MTAAPLAPMEAVTADTLPSGSDWHFEPKWDGFRCIAQGRRGKVALWSKSGKPLGRYFPEIVERLARVGGDFLADGELLIARDGQLAFDALQMRLHPAESRVRRLADETPAMLMLFDLLEEAGRSLIDLPLSTRRARLEDWHAEVADDQLRRSPSTHDREVALGWLARSGGALDGVIAKRLSDPYRPGERGFVKVKTLRSADCVVGGFRYASSGTVVGSLLLGLYDAEGRLHHVGFTSALKGEDKPALTSKLEALIAEPGFSGDAPGGPSRWSNGRSAEWQPLAPRLVVEVRYDQVTTGRFRHGTRLLRWRPDKAPSQCRCDQLAPALTPAQLAELFG